jgi:SAM-dependent methyltransferase
MSLTNTLRKAAFVASIAILCTLPPGFSAAQTFSDLYERETGRQPDVIFVPTPQNIVDDMLTLAGLRPGERLYDLGCGDGRIVVTAAKEYGADAVGVDIDPNRIAESRENAERAGVADKVKFIQGDLFKTNFRDADVVSLYLLPSLNEKLRPRLLRELRPGTRIVSHAFSMGDWTPDKTSGGGRGDVYLWFVPADVDGTWSINFDEGAQGTLKLRQKYQKVDGRLELNGENHPFEGARLRGSEMTFDIRSGAGTRRITAVFNGGRAHGSLKEPDGIGAWSGQRRTLIG